MPSKSRYKQSLVGIAIAIAGGCHDWQDDWLVSPSSAGNSGTAGISSAGSGNTIAGTSGDSGAGAGGNSNEAGTAGSGGSAGSGPDCDPGFLMLCGRAANGLRCAKTTGEAAFGHIQPLQSELTDADGWGDPSIYPTLQFPDLNGDGRVDVCGRYMDGIRCALANPHGFGRAELWESGFGDASVWNDSEAHYGTIRFPDITGDGKADVCGLGGVGADGIWCSVSDGKKFTNFKQWESNFSSENQWTLHRRAYATIQFPDIDGDAKADVCGLSELGVYCAVSDGQRFVNFQRWESQLTVGEGFGDKLYYSTVQFPRLNADSSADLCARAKTGIVCQLSNAKSEFTQTKVWHLGFSDLAGWADWSYASTVRFPDINGDGFADVCGRSALGVECALSDAGNGFLTKTLWQAEFSDSEWREVHHYSTIQFPDLNADGKADICGRAKAGIVCGISNGTTAFGPLKLVQAEFSDAGEGNDFDGSLQFVLGYKGTCARQPTPGAPVPHWIRLSKGE